MLTTKEVILLLRAFMTCYYSHQLFLLSCGHFKHPNMTDNISQRSKLSGQKTQHFQQKLKKVNVFFLAAAKLL